MKLKPIKIGKIKIKTPLFLAPMVDVTDLPYRLMCRKAGAGMACTEMLYLDAILHENPKTLRLQKTNSKDTPSGIQITGNTPSEFLKALPYLKKFDIVDINCGCPSEKIIGNQAGSYLLNNPEKIEEIIKILKSAGLTVTAKIRLGYNFNNALKIAKMIEKAGADALTVHARLATEGYDKKADWNEIKKIKQALHIPVIGNGDILREEDVLAMLKIADGAMIARGAIGDPLIFKRTLHYLKTGKKIPFSFKENIKSFKEYLQLSKKYDCIDIPRMKYLGSKFIKNTEGAGKLRMQLMQLKTFEEIFNFVDNL
ncbi:MAG: tRNA-dihydrouridine synthase family protein [archaeon]